MNDLTTEQESLPPEEAAKKKTPHQLGCFFISQDLILEMPNEVKEIMGQCIILRAEFVYSKDGIEYQAISNQFKPISHGECMPYYKWGFDESGKPFCKEFDPWSP